MLKYNINILKKTLVAHFNIVSKRQWFSHNTLHSYLFAQLESIRFFVTVSYHCLRSCNHISITDEKYYCQILPVFTH